MTALYLEKRNNANGMQDSRMPKKAVARPRSRQTSLKNSKYQNGLIPRNTKTKKRNSVA
jgi:hypothetical protein